jgi:hypothetical protein
MRGDTARILDSHAPMPGNTVTVDAAELASLHDRMARLDALARRRGRQLRLLLVTGGTLLALGLCFGTGLSRLRQQLSSCHERLIESRHENSALAATDGIMHRAATGDPARSRGPVGAGI